MTKDTSRDRRDVPGDQRRPKWTKEQATTIKRSRDNVASVIEPLENDPAPDVHVWDTWLLRNRQGKLATIDGWRVLFSLTAPADMLPGKRHDVAEIQYFYSRDGEEWHPGGPVFDGDALGQRQWAGSALNDDDGTLYVYYTAAGDDDESELTYTQRIAGARGCTLTVSDSSVAIEGVWTHETLLEPDGKWYETQNQSRGMMYTFRDPWFFEDPATGETHLLFEANTPIPEDSAASDGERPHQEFNGSVGIATSPTGDPLEWELRPPLLDAVCVNQELERPHLVPKDGRYYLFLSSHMHTFTPDLTGYDGLYGFVADSLRGNYQPLNGSGLVVTNPATAPFQAYSWMAFPHEEEVLVQSFFNFRDFSGDSLDEIAEFSDAEQLRRFRGTLSPTLRLAVEGNTTRVRGTLDHWHIPTPDEPLPPVDTDRPLSEADIEDVSRQARGRADWRDDYY